MKTISLLMIMLVGCSWQVRPAYQEPQPTIQQEYSYECRDGFVWEVNWTKTTYKLVYNDDGTEMHCNPNNNKWLGNITA